MLKSSSFSSLPAIKSRDVRGLDKQTIVDERKRVPNQSLPEKLREFLLEKGMKHDMSFAGRGYGAAYHMDCVVTQLEIILFNWRYKKYIILYSSVDDGQAIYADDVPVVAQN